MSWFGSEFKCQRDLQSPEMCVWIFLESPRGKELLKCWGGMWEGGSWSKVWAGQFLGNVASSSHKTPLRFKHFNIFNPKCHAHLTSQRFHFRFPAHLHDPEGMWEATHALQSQKLITLLKKCLEPRLFEIKMQAVSPRAGLHLVDVLWHRASGSVSGGSKWLLWQWWSTGIPLSPFPYSH